MSDHSPEPWAYEDLGSDRFDVRDNDGQGVFAEEIMPDAADASRIVACVNACAGHSTEDLEKAARGEVLAVLGRTRELMDALRGAPAGEVIEMPCRCCCGEVTTVHTTLDGL
jgi:hypothetical protein